MTDVITDEDVKTLDVGVVVELDELDQQLVGQLVDRARSQGLRLTGEDGLLAQLTKDARQNNLGFRCRGGYGCDNGRHGGSRGLGGVEVHGAAPAPG